MEEKNCVKCNSVATNKKFNLLLCDICHYFSPHKEEEFREYIGEKIDGRILETFRKYIGSSGQRQKKGMIKKASQGKLMSRIPFGYVLENKQLIPAQNHKEIEEIFEEFLNKNNLSLENIKTALISQGLIIPQNQNITLCGEAAGLTKPWSGGGVIWGLMAADILLKNFPNFYKEKIGCFLIQLFFVQTKRL